MLMLQVKLTALLLLASKMVVGSSCTVNEQAAYAKGKIVKIPQDCPNNITYLHVELFTLLQLASKGDLKSACSDKYQLAFCFGLGIVKIPQGLSNNITYLHIRYSHIETIEMGDFDNYGQLEDVFITNSSIETVDVKAFAHLTQLQSVSLPYNRLTHVDNTIFINNNNLTYLDLSSNKLLFNPVIPFLISSSIETLHLRRCNISEITNKTFSKMEKLKKLFMYENDILRLDAASFKYNLLQELYIDFAEEITPTLTELICKNVYVLCKNDVHNFCQGNSTKELKCNLTTPKTSTNSPHKETKETVTTEERAESTTEMKNSSPNEKYSVSASPEEPVTTPVRAESNTEMTTQTIAMDPALVYVFSSFALISTGLSVTVLVLYLKKQKSKTNGSKPETSSSPEYKFTLVENDEVNDGYEVARNNDLYLVQMQPDVLPVWPSVKAPRCPLPLPSLPVTRGSINSYHEYEEIRDQ